MDVSSQSLKYGTNRMFKPLAMGHSSFTISHYYCVKQIRTLLWLLHLFLLVSLVRQHVCL
ncbi:hypothetical protein FDX01_00365 [Citrobacter sp. wls613]|uniref:Uncharacterized protein n=1 Tax=Citrobacter gillenii TaxID=67828 RepID=A0ABD6M4F4_9ENTR|nr:hypothetical protein [Citrobacter gillenii]QCA17094.1 hypothetical protein E5284_04080 [Citrobacter freundii]TKU36035.1 hypothetical protein FDW95_04430 [Citrobacter sp. wls718]TKU66250.1 hypothetical protein FDW98_01540 [Citrobacter sp. wls711]TKU87598.1 hypothetical protein FDX22_23155 [Citrobacter sp. TBCS-14]TKV24947.1 hypothetical protein FDX01_00365 [Citrobacter sp. wls613]